VDVGGNTTLALLAEEHGVDAVVTMGDSYNRTWADEKKHRCLLIQ
jgi:hypothetical protein